VRCVFDAVTTVQELRGAGELTREDISAIRLAWQDAAA
jgi:hypothetical protein